MSTDAATRCFKNPYTKMWCQMLLTRFNLQSAHTRTLTDAHTGHEDVNATTADRTVVKTKQVDAAGGEPPQHAGRSDANRRGGGVGGGGRHKHRVGWSPTRSFTSTEYQQLRALELAVGASGAAARGAALVAEISLAPTASSSLLQKGLSLHLISCVTFKESHLGGWSPKGKRKTQMFTTFLFAESIFPKDCPAAEGQAGGKRKRHSA